MSTGIWILLILFLIGAGVYAFFRDNLPKAYRGRGCLGRTWKHRFPDASSDEIRRFLTIFVDAWGFREQHRLKFSPDDRLMGIYKAVYTWPWMADALETEVFVMNLEDEYKTQCPEQLMSKDATLAEIFAYMRTNRHTTDRGLSAPGGGSFA